MENHRKHEFHPLHEVASSQKKQVSEILQTTKDKKEELENSIRAIEIRIEEIKNQGSDLELKVKESFIDIISELHKREAALLNNLQTAVQNTLELLSAQSIPMREVLEKVESHCQVAALYVTYRKFCENINNSIY